MGWQGRQVFSFAGANCDNLFICAFVECFRKSCILFTPPSVSWIGEGVFDITVWGGIFIDLEHFGQYDKISIILNGKLFWSCVVLRKKWDKVFKIGLNEVFEGCLPQNLLSLKYFVSPMSWNDKIDQIVHFRMANYHLKFSGKRHGYQKTNYKITKTWSIITVSKIKWWYVLLMQSLRFQRPYKQITRSLKSVSWKYAIAICILSCLSVSVLIFTLCCIYFFWYTHDDIRSTVEAKNIWESIFHPQKLEKRTIF